MQAEPTTIEKLRGLKWSIASNAANTVMVQYTFFGSVFVLFLDALGLSKGQMGFLLSLLPFFGLTALFVAPAVERFGYKRTYVTFFGLRAVVAAGLLLTPWVFANFGPETTLLFVAAIMALFSMVRSIGVTASYPWVQQYVPNNVRGKYTATNNIFTTITGFIAVTIGGVVLDRTTGLNGFMLLLAVGVIFGFISVGLALLIPGGAPQTRAADEGGRDLISALRDRDFVSYLIGVSLLTLVTVPLASFLPLFMGEQVGLSESAVVWLQTGTLAGTLASSYLWGWAADRYGSKPVTFYGLALRILLPVMWMVMPRHSDLSLAFALSIAFLQGVADMGWGIGSGRLLYVSVVPVDKRTDYMALYYAWTGIVGGISQLSGGYILQASQNLSGRIWVFAIDPYTPLFLAGVILPILSMLLLLVQVREERGVGVGEFAGIFLRGNPFLAMTSMIRYHLAKDEHSTVLMTELLGEAKSPLTVEELLGALEDPRFSVRFEAIVSIARMPPDRRLIDALIDILEGSELALTVVAAWALGRLGDRYAVPALRRALDSDYRSVRAHAARALGALGAAEVAPELIDRLATETDKGLQMAYAATLGSVKAVEGVPVLLHLLDVTENPGARLELALTLARIVGDESAFITLLRHARSDTATAIAQSLAAFRRRNRGIPADAASTMDQCEAAFTRGDLARGSRCLGDAIDLLPLKTMRHTGGGAPAAGRTAAHNSASMTAQPAAFAAAQDTVLAECARQLRAHGSERADYVLLAVHLLMLLRLPKK